MSELREKIYFSAFRIAACAGIGFLALVFLLLLKAGGGVLGWHFLTQPWSHRDITQGGIFQGIIGSLYLGIGVLLISVPFGVATAIFLTEYSRENVWKRIVELAIQNLAGVPSVVYGLFALAVFVNIFHFGSSLLSAALGLSIMVLPWIIIASVESLQSVPRRFRESSFALGATRLETIQKITLPAALPGIITGAVIGLARALGETAPIIIVGATFYMSGLPRSVFDKFMALPYHTFILATQHSSPFAPAYAAATALVLIVLTFFLSAGAMMIRSVYRRKKDW